MHLSILDWIVLIEKKFKPLPKKKKSCNILTCITSAQPKHVSWKKFFKAKCHNLQLTWKL
jgi:hypothetical protein